MNPRDFILSRSGQVNRTREGYWAFWPDPLPPGIDWSSDLLLNLSQAERSVGELAALARLVPNFADFYNLLVTREACRSCQIDGIEAEFFDFLHAQSIPGSLVSNRHEIQAAQGILDALELAHAESSSESPLTLETLARLHARMLQDVPGQSSPPGAFRREQNWIGPSEGALEGARFVPPPAERLPRGLDQLDDFINRNVDLPGLLRLGLIHYQFETLHPFPSGNGRLGRILVSILPAIWGELPGVPILLSDYLYTRRQSYFDALLAVSQRSAWNEWLVFFLEGVSRSARQAAEAVFALQASQAQMQERISAARPKVPLSQLGRLNRLLDFCAARPVFTVRQVEAALGVNFAVAQRYVNQLEAWGMIEEVTGQARNRVYRARWIMELLGRGGL